MQTPPQTGLAEAFHLGPWRVDPASRELRAGDTSRRLSPKAMGVLQQLSQAEGRVLTRDLLIERVWPNVVVGEEVLTHAVAELRRALGDRSRQPRFVETVHKSGYRLLQPAVPESSSPESSPNTLTAASERTSQPPAPARIAPIAPELYMKCLEAAGRYQRGGRGNLLTAATLYGEVAEAAPGFVHARIGLAEALAFIYMYYLPREEHLRQSLVLASDAAQAAPNAARAHAVLGLAVAAAGDYRKALERFGTALALDPQSFEAHYLFGRAAFAEGDLATAAPLLAQAGRIAQGDFHMLYLSAKAYRGLGDNVSAQRLCKQALAGAEAYLSYDPIDLRATCDRICCLVELGDIERAQTLAEAVVDTDDPMAYYLACSLARAGETGWALDCLEAVVDGGWRHAGWLRFDPDLDHLRQDRRFRKIQRYLESA